MIDINFLYNLIVFKLIFCFLFELYREITQINEKVWFLKRPKFANKCINEGYQDWNVFKNFEKWSEVIGVFQVNNKKNSANIT